ncbi:hypothetical protein COCSADRAFT_209102 [Bipolaris sorokiniana ND90Pr]|uniref:Uncharacterized protein n=1 Tax=Cochliobolus sativus (strain ND90Pr / ATCC 201652) TaxID=665912 RepID=M2T4H5_COCSN|nr:uncharacterized protein COCSADRAFT_209102 [Bipolaris sorokiniana ND90Pr]EMD69345.1 hypothetical protein COCSADRAFT_209102 [Bipolaris sorokiniana ND90Pr]
MKLASPLACVGVFDFTFWLFFFQHTQPICISLCLFVLCHCSLLRAARWIDIPSSRSLTVKLCRQLSLRQTYVQSPCLLRLHVRCLQISFHQMMRFVHISLSMSVPEVPYARFSVQPSYFLFPLANIATPRRCITAAARLAVACPLVALHR